VQIFIAYLPLIPNFRFNPYSNELQLVLPLYLRFFKQKTMGSSTIEIKKSEIKVRILLFHFIDEKGISFVYSPHLDITGYGYSLEEARKSFEIVFEDFLDYTTKKATLGRLLNKLGWKQVKGTVKKPLKALAPSITSVIAGNKYIADLFDRYPLHTFYKEVEMPLAV